MAEPKLRRYKVPSQNCEGWGIFVIGSDGYFSVVSDYGNYAYLWTHHGHEDFRTFLVGLAKDDDYLASKISRKDVLQGKQTAKCIKETVLQVRRTGNKSREWARDEWDLADSLDDDSISYADWYQETKLEDAWDYATYDYPSEARAFCKKLYPRFVELLKAELNAE